MRRLLNAHFSAATAVMAAVYLLGSCVEAQAAQPAPADKTPAKKTSTAPAPQTSPAAAAPLTNKFLSVFSTDNPRDPFNPQVKPRGSSAPVLTGSQGSLDQP